MTPRLPAVLLLTALALALPLLAAPPALADWGACDECHQGTGGGGSGFPYGVCAHCHHVINFGPFHDPENPDMVCGNCHGPDGLHTTHHWVGVCQECHGPVHIQKPHVYEVTPRNPSSPDLHPNSEVRILGTNLGDTQGTSVVRVGPKRYKAGSKKVLSWSNTEVRLVLPLYLSWPSGTTQTRKVWVNIGGKLSNKMTVSITEP
jgi:hypothetical protein